GMQVDLQMDLGRAAMQAAMDKFHDTMMGADFAAIYFAGHGAVADRENYLVPVDADLSNPGAIESLFSLSNLRRRMGLATHRLIVLDACRNNPSDGWRQKDTMNTARVRAGGGGGGKGRGGAAGDPEPTNGIIIFSTAPGRVALDGPPGENSPFAAAFLRQFDSGSVEIQSLPSRLRRDLLIATQGRQVVWDQNSFTEPFTITGTPGASGGARGGWGGDPSKIVELPNTYAYAAQNGIPLAPGMVAHRPAGNSKDSLKIGGFKYPNGPNREPAILIVMSVDEGQSAEAITAGRFADGSMSWRFVRATISGDTLEFVPSDQRPKQSFKWNSAAGGSVTMIPTGHGGTGSQTIGGNSNAQSIKSYSFERLDG
ncbi:MAG: caspase family protein, partial [Alphaproteobacteria bacterium]|nr:caspase family protein [Alphaproteobacteria bacterium]